MQFKACLFIWNRTKWFIWICYGSIKYLFIFLYLNFLYFVQLLYQLSDCIKATMGPKTMFFPTLKKLCSSAQCKRDLTRDGLGNNVSTVQWALANVIKLKIEIYHLHLLKQMWPIGSSRYSHNSSYNCSLVSLWRRRRRRRKRKTTSTNLKRPWLSPLA